MRREIHEGLQVVENWNSANKDLFYGKDGDLAGADKESQEVSMLALHLLQSALVHVNTLLMQQVLAHPKWADTLTDADRRALSPLFWTHVNPYGRFELDMNRRLDLDLTTRHARFPVGTGVVAVAGQWASGRHDQPCVGVDADLVVGGIAVVLAGRGHAPVAGRDQGAVHDQDRVGRVPAPDGGQSKKWSDVVDDPICCRLRDPGQRAQLSHRQVRPPVRSHQQDAVLQRQSSRSAAGGLAPTSTPYEHHELAELPLVQSREQTNPLRLTCRHHSMHVKIITRLSRAYGTSFSPGRRGLPWPDLAERSPITPACG